MSEIAKEKRELQDIKIFHPIKYNWVNTDKKYEFSGHSHSDWELKIVLSGTLRATSDDTVYKLSGGDAILLEPGIFHREVSDKADYIVLLFYAKGIAKTGKSHVFRLGTTDFELLRVIKHYCDIFSAEERIRDPLKRVVVFEDEASKYTIMKLTEVLLYRFFGNEGAELAPQESRGAEIYNRAVVFMKNNLDKNLSLGEVAKECGACTTVLKNVFSKYAGHGVMSHFTYMRMMKAKSMLEEGVGVSEVSSALGFSSQSYFSQCFKRECGVSPSKYVYEW